MKNTFTPDQKQLITDLYNRKRTALGFSHAKAARDAGTSGPVISQVFSGKYNADDEAIFRLIANWVEYDPNQWKLVETRNMKFVTGLLEEAAKNKLTFAMVGPAGFGKTAAQKHYRNHHRNVYLIHCEEWWTKKIFLQEILQRMGRDHRGLSFHEMINDITTQIIQQDNPLILIDEADKLKNDVLYLFISLYNRLEDKCGIVMSATSYLTKRLERGLQFNYKGYQEIWSRIGRRPVSILKTSKRDVEHVCRANGIDDADTIARIVHECEGDFRRVKKAVFANKLQQVNPA